MLLLTTKASVTKGKTSRHFMKYTGAIVPSDERAGGPLTASLGDR